MDGNMSDSPGSALTLNMWHTGNKIRDKLTAVAEFSSFN